MPIRSSRAAKKAMTDGDLLECLTSSSAVNTRSTNSQASSTPNPRFLFGYPTDASTRTCRNHVADGKSLLQKQKAVVWNRPSLSRPEIMWRQGTEDVEITSYRKHTMQSLTELRDEKETACTDETNSDKQKQSPQALPTLSTRVTNARHSLSKRLETKRANTIF
jgi:hypothetical protein